MAIAGGPAGAPTPTFVEGPKVQRFLLPTETILADVVRDLVEAAGDDYRLWDAALPPSPTAALAVYRVLRERGDPAAEHALQRVLDAEVPTTDPRGALALASKAEALALAGRLPEAVTRYRESLDRMPEGGDRRILAFNLANIEGRLGNVEAMTDAWDEARAPDLHDPVNVRMAEAVRPTRSGSPGAAEPTDRREAGRRRPAGDL